METNEKAKILYDAKSTSLLDHKNTSFKNYSLIYRSTNEMLSEVCKNFDFNDRDILTVCASGDQYLSFLLFGAKSVTNFDINLLTRYYLILKQIGVLTLSLDEFKKFFLIGNGYSGFNISGFFDEKMYLKIQKYLPEDVKCFWDSMYSTSKSRLVSDEKSIFQPHFIHDLEKLIPYLSKKNYKKLAGILEKQEVPKFIHSDAEMIASKSFKDTFDIIYLSNVGDYVPDVNEWIIYLLEELKKLLKENGLIINYRWGEGGKSIDYIESGFNETVLTTLECENYAYSYKNNKGSCENNN